MKPDQFDDARLEAAELVDHEELRWLALAGARIRTAALSEPVGHIARVDRPRGILVFGTESRLVRAVLEPVCPVPFMAWPGPSLPAWVGPLDLVVILGGYEAPEWQLQCAAQAARRGAAMIVAAPGDSQLAAAASGSVTTLIPMRDADPMAAAIAVLAVLGQLEIGPSVPVDEVAAAADLVAENCSPVRDLTDNPAKELAIGLADRIPLLWGGTVLAARASRRIAEALREASGRVALAADAGELEIVLRGTPPADPFADPYEAGAEASPALLVLEDDKVPEALLQPSMHLRRLADAIGVPAFQITSGELTSSDVERYVTLLQRGKYTAAYLGIGLGKSVS